MIDVNVSLGFWPFQDTASLTAAKLVKYHREEHIAGALVSSTEAILFPDPDIPDAALFKKLDRYPTLSPVKTINPTLIGWEDSLDDFIQRGAVAVKLYPNYHSYSLADTAPRALMAELNRRRIPVMIAIRIEDERQHFPLMRVPPVPFEDIIELSAAFPRVPVIVLNAYYREIIGMPPGRKNLFADIAFAEHPDTVAEIVKRVPSKHIVFGSHTPFFTLRAERNKMRFASISPQDISRIADQNAIRIFRIE